MKKILSLLIITMFLIVGCQKEEFYFKHNGKEMHLNEVFSISKYGEYQDSFETENCALESMVITYFYDGYEINTYNTDNRNNVVYAIYLKDERIKTTEGIKLNDKLEDVLKIYGDDYLLKDNKYTYNKGDTSLIFTINDSYVKEIEYRIKGIFDII